jgi:hypothetical protein
MGSPGLAGGQFSGEPLKIEQCRRLAGQITDPTTSRRLLDLADEYVQYIKHSSEK